MPTSTSLPEQPLPLPGASAPAPEASNFERMQAELKAVQQQALATQQSIAQLQTRKSADPFSAIVSDLPPFAAGIGTPLGVVTALALAGVVVWWSVSRRPRNRWPVANDTRMQAAKSVPVPTPAPTSAPTPQQPAPEPWEDKNDWASSTTPSQLSAAGFESVSANARLDRDIAFDSEAAAAEVTRVRKSLAEKRDARAQLLERELDLDLDLDEPHVTPLAQIRGDTNFTNAVSTEREFDLDLDLELEPALELESAVELDPWLQPGESLPGATEDPYGAEAVHFSLALDDYGVKPDFPAAPEPHSHDEFAMDLTPKVEAESVAEAAIAAAPPPETAAQTDTDEFPTESVAKSYDFTITMALAQESAALELWTEARDLATEVLTSENAALRSQAEVLLERLDQLEKDAPPDTNWGTVR